MSGPGLLVRAGLGLLLLTATLGTPADADLWGHLTFGRDIISTGHVIQADRYSFTSDRPWINHEWLTEVSVAGVYRLAGSAGLVVLKLAVIAALLLVIWRHVKRLHPSAPMSVAILTLAFVGTFWRTHTVRPQLFSVLFFAILLVAMVRSGEGRRRSLLILGGVPPLMVLWVNFHGGWLVGLGILGLWTIVQLLDRRVMPAHRLMLAAVGIAAVGATLLNPYGLQMWTFLGETVRLGRDDIEEWGSILTHPVALGLPWALTLAAAGAAFWRSPQVRRFDYAAIVLLLAVMSFRVSRLDAFFALAVVILLTPGLVLLTGSARRVTSPGETSPVRATPRFGIILITVVAVGAMLWPAAPLIRHYATCLPVAGPWPPEPEAAQFIARNRLQGRMVTWFDWGEYAIWHFGPDLRVSMDGRRETVYTAATIQAHRRLYAGDETALPYLRNLNPDYIWLPNRLPIAARLAGEGWTTIFSGPISAVFARPGAGPFQDAGASSTAVRCFPGP